MSPRPAPLAEQVATLRRAALAIPAHALVPEAIHALILACLVRLLDRFAELIRAWQEGRLPPPPTRTRPTLPSQPRPNAPHAPHAPGARQHRRDSAAWPSTEATTGPKPRQHQAARWPKPEHSRRIPAHAHATASAPHRPRVHRFARSPPPAVQKPRAAHLPTHAIFVTISK